jgi:hypothetical protein
MLYNSCRGFRASLENNYFVKYIGCIAHVEALGDFFIIYNSCTGHGEAAEEVT